MEENESKLNNLREECVTLVDLVEKEKRFHQSFSKSLSNSNNENKLKIEKKEERVDKIEEKIEKEIPKPKPATTKPSPPLAKAAAPLFKLGGKKAAGKSTAPEIVIDYEKLKNKEGIEGLNTSKLETYLSEDQFKEVFDMTREEFQKMAEWQQVRMRKSKGLF